LTTSTNSSIAAGELIRTTLPFSAPSANCRHQPLISELIRTEVSRIVRIRASPCELLALRHQSGRRVWLQHLRRCGRSLHRFRATAVPTSSDRLPQLLEAVPQSAKPSLARRWIVFANQPSLRLYNVNSSFRTLTPRSTAQRGTRVAGRNPKALAALSAIRKNGNRTRVRCPSIAPTGIERPNPNDRLRACFVLSPHSSPQEFLDIIGQR
jgi:hypothetical protein